MLLLNKHVGSKEAILRYLVGVFEDDDPALIAAALNDVARVEDLANNPELSSDTDISAVIRTLKALGLELTAKAA